MNKNTYTYRKLKLEDLEMNKSYKFYRKDGINFTATFYCILNTTLQVKNYVSNDDKDKSAIRTMPTNWITHAESEEFKVKVNNFM